MNERDIEETRPGMGDRIATFVVRVFRLIVRLSLVALLGASLGAAAYFGAPALYRNYIEPVQTNSQRIAELEAAIIKAQSDSRSRATEIGELLASIEGQQASQNEVVAELQAKVENLQTALAQQKEETIDLQHLADRVNALQVDSKKTADAIEALETSLTGTDIPVQHFEQQLQLIRVMELLTRARLWLTQDNFGLASEDVETAMQALEGLVEAAPEEEANTLQMIIERLDLALRALPDSPVIAADDLEIAWKLLVTATELPVVPSD